MRHNEEITSVVVDVILRFFAGVSLDFIRGVGSFDENGGGILLFIRRGIDCFEYLGT